MWKVEKGKHKLGEVSRSKKKTCRVVYWTICKDQNKGDQKYDLFKIAKRIVKTNRDTTGGQCIRDGILEIGDEDKKLTWESYHEKLLNTYFVWHGYSLLQADKVIDRPYLIHNDMVRESISEIKNRKAAEPPGLVS